MAYISQIKYNEASDEVRKEIDYQVKEHGRITNMKLTLLHSLPAYRALMEWFPLEKTIEEFLGERAVNFFCYAISTENDCLVCGTFFQKIIDDLGIDMNNFEFTTQENLLMDYGKAIIRDANHVPSELFQQMKQFWTEEQIVSITGFASIMIATNLINKILDVELDDYLVPYTRG